MASESYYGSEEGQSLEKEIQEVSPAHGEPRFP